MPNNTAIPNSAWNLLSGAWLIDDTFAQRAMEHLRGVNWTAHMAEYSDGVPLESTPYALEDGIAHFALSGPLMRGMSSMQEMFGGTATVLFRRDLSLAANDPNVTGGVLEVDSPGGTVDGTPELAAAIRAFAAKKPLAVYVEGMACSAGYWAASQGGRLFASTGATLGSIGAYATMTDPTRLFVSKGVDPITFRTGKHKGLGNPGVPFTDANKAMLTRWLEGAASDFFTEVATARHLSVETIRNMEAAIFNARDALENGLIDEIGGIEQAVAWVKQQAAMGAGKPRGATMNPIQTIQAGLAAIGIGAGDENPPEQTATLTTATATLNESPLLAACREHGITDPAALAALKAQAALGEQYTADMRAAAKAEYIRAVGQDKADPERVKALEAATFMDAKNARDIYKDAADAKFGTGGDEAPKRASAPSVPENRALDIETPAEMTEARKAQLLGMTSIGRRAAAASNGKGA